MIVDTSAIIAILRDEDDAAAYADALANADVRRLSAASYLECGIVLDSQRDPVISRALDELIEEAEFVVEPVTERQARLARAAYADFGRGSGHPAGLNFGDCLSYALAIDRREPLLWKGNDFGHTGVQRALDRVIDVSLARRCEAHGYDYFRSDDPVAAAGFVVSAVWSCGRGPGNATGSGRLPKPLRHS